MESPEQMANRVQQHFGFVACLCPEERKRGEIVSDVIVAGADHQLSQPVVIIGDTTEEEWREHCRFAGIAPGGWIPEAHYYRVVAE